MQKTQTCFSMINNFIVIDSISNSSTVFYHIFVIVSDHICRK